MDDERYQRFDRDVGELKVGDAVGRETWLGRLGVVTAVAGPALCVVAYLGSMEAEDPLMQRDMIVLALLGVSLTVLGVGLFIRYSAIRFFRYWAARTVYEIAEANRPGRTHIDERTYAG
jgi:hypothetical protein